MKTENKITKYAVDRDYFNQQVEKQLDLLHTLASETGHKIANADSLNRDEVSRLIDEMKETKLNQDAEASAREVEDNHKQQELIGD